MTEEAHFFNKRLGGILGVQHEPGLHLGVVAAGHKPEDQVHSTFYPTPFFHPPPPLGGATHLKIYYDHVSSGLVPAADGQAQVNANPLFVQKKNNEEVGNSIKI